jgi:hypothetical protein
MIFYVYFDPQVISNAEHEGIYARQLLIATLRGFLQNCFLAEFEDHRLQEAIKEQVNSLPESFDRKLIKSLLSTLHKRNRFIFCLYPDYFNNKSDRQLLVEQAGTAMIDLALLALKPDGDPAIDGLEAATLANYQQTQFELLRFNLAVNGKTTATNTSPEQDFLDFHFKKALRHANRIDFCDRLFGSKYADNFEYTVRRMLNWMQSVLADPGSCIITFHCEKPNGSKDKAIEAELRNGIKGKLKDLKIRVVYYDVTGLSECLPHERFVFTDQVAIGIDRGLDFLDKGTRRARDVFVTYKKIEECESVLQYYRNKQTVSPIVVDILNNYK